LSLLTTVTPSPARSACEKLVDEPVAVELGGVDVGDAKLDGATNQRDLAAGSPRRPPNCIAPYPTRRARRCGRQGHRVCPAAGCREAAC